MTYASPKEGREHKDCEDALKIENVNYTLFAIMFLWLTVTTGWPSVKELHAVANALCVTGDADDQNALRDQKDATWPNIHFHQKVKSEK